MKLLQNIALRYIFKFNHSDAMLKTEKMSYFIAVSTLITRFYHIIRVKNTTMKRKKVKILTTVQLSFEQGN